VRIGSEQEFAGEFAPDIEVKRGGGIMKRGGESCF